MRSRVAAAALLVLTLAAPGALFAARDGLSAPGPATALELVIFERADCAYCEIFRRDVAPRYRTAPAARRAPIRFVDIDRVDLGNIGLKSRLSVVPTAVLMKNGHEVDRIPGYTGPETFFRLVPILIDRAE